MGVTELWEPQRTYFTFELVPLQCPILTSMA